MLSRTPSQSLLFTFVALFLVSFGACATEYNQSSPSPAAVAAFDQASLIAGDRTVEGLVEHVTDDNIKVNIGEMQPLFLPMKEAREKGFPSIKPGDKLKIVLNDQNLIVDFHPIDKAPPGVARTSPPKGAQQRIEGMIVKSLSESEIRIKLLNGEERPYEVRSIAYDKLAAMKEGQDVILLVGEDNTVVDVAAPPEGKN